MTQTLILQFLEAQRTAVETALRGAELASPTQRCAFLDRMQPVGDNDPKPLVIIQRRQTSTRRDTSTCALDHTMEFHVKLYLNRSSLLTPFSAQVDPVWQVVHPAVMAVVDDFPWCQAIEPVATDVEPTTADGNIVPGLMVCVYTAQIMTSALDLTATP